MAYAGYVWTKLLGAYRGSAPGFFQVFTALYGYTTVVRDITFSNLETTSVTAVVDFSITGLEIDLLRSSVEPNRTLHQEGRAVVPAGAVCRVYSSGSLFTVTITGYRFLGDEPAIALLPASTSSAVAQPQ